MIGINTTSAMDYFSETSDNYVIANITDDDQTTASEHSSDLSEIFHQPLQLASNDDISVNPHGWGEHDVPIGRSQDVHSFVGNIRYRQLIGEYAAAYAAAKKRCEKTLVSIQIYNTITANGGRFLDKSKATKQWEEISNEKALSKISQALRMFTRRGRKAAVKPVIQDECSPFEIPSSSAMLQEPVISIVIPPMGAGSDFEPVPLTALSRQTKIDSLSFDHFSFDN